MTKDSLNAITLVLGGARSGKSEFAEKLVLESGFEPVYLATAAIYGEDEEMRERIAIHRHRRMQDTTGRQWKTIEEPLKLCHALQECATHGHAVLVDCLTLWITNMMLAGMDVIGEADQLVAALSQYKAPDNTPDKAPIVIVSNEVGLGIIGDNKMARQFVDLAGLVNRKLAAVADHVWFVTAGLPMLIKPQK